MSLQEDAKKLLDKERKERFGKTMASLVEGIQHVEDRIKDENEHKERILTNIEKTEKEYEDGKSHPSIRPSENRCSY